MFKNKKIYISPHTRTSDTLAKFIKQNYKDVQILGFIDKVQTGKDIFKLNEIDSELDYVLIHSPNHYRSILSDLKVKISSKKLIKVENIENNYVFLTQKELFKKTILNLPLRIKEFCFKILTQMLDRINFKRDKVVLVSKTFVGGNNKFLFFALHNSGIDTLMLTQNKTQLAILRRMGYKALELQSLKAFVNLAFAKWIVVDQGDNNDILSLKSQNQKIMQLWHGIPLEHMNRLTNITYDAFISTSEFVSETGFKKVFLSKEFLSFGYPRNDAFMKPTHNEVDLVFTDTRIYNFVKSARQNGQKIIAYMPTWRESDFIGQIKQIDTLSIDFKTLNEFLIPQNAYFIIKFHPFVAMYFKDFLRSCNFSNILFHETQGDFYPILKYCDVLAGDYSSVYYDFLLLDRPLLFYLYDHGKCSKMAQGYIYEFDDYSPGEKAFNQPELHEKLAKILSGNDDFKLARRALTDKLFKFKDDKASERVVEYLKENL